MGDIHLRLFADQVSKTVENFVGLARKGYYDNVLFHRVIPKFMLQTGDPLGDGTGGESLWGREFEDEFKKELRHDRPYTLSMANAGPNTNGASQCLPLPCASADALPIPRQSILHHHRADAVAGQQAHRLWALRRGPGRGARHRERALRQVGPATRGH